MPFLCKYLLYYCVISLILHDCIINKRINSCQVFSTKKLDQKGEKRIWRLYGLSQKTRSLTGKPIHQKGTPLEQNYASQTKILKLVGDVVCQMKAEGIYLQVHQYWMCCLKDFL